MSSARIKPSPKETTVFELKIERLRQLAAWGRGLAILYTLVMVILIINPLLKYPFGQINLEGQVNFISVIVLYVGSLVLDFLADLGIIVLSMKRESQYVSKVVQEVRGG